VFQTLTRRELLRGLSMLAVKAERPEKTQPSGFFHCRKPDLRLTKASAGRARRLEICIHLLSITRKRPTRSFLLMGLRLPLTTCVSLTKRSASRSGSTHCFSTALTSFRSRYSGK